MKRFIFLILTTLLFSQEIDWRTHQHDNQRTGFTPYKGNFEDTLYIFWHQFVPHFTNIPPVVGDVDNDGDMEIVVLGSWYYPPHLVVHNGSTGDVEWVYTLVLNDYDGGGSFPVIEDVNNDGINEIVVPASYYNYNSEKSRGRIYILNTLTHDTLWCFKDDTLFFTGVAVDDVDGDSLNEIIFGAGKVTGTGTSIYPYIPSIYILNGEDGSVYWIIDSVFVYQRDSNCVYDPNIYPLPVGSYPVLGDLNGDGVTDIVGVKLHSDSTWHLCGIDAKNKTILWENDYSSFDQCVSDLDNDGMNEIVTSFFTYGHLFLRCFEGNSGILKWEYNFVGTHPAYEIFQPAIGDLDGDGNKEVVFVSDADSAGYEDRGTIFILNKNGDLLYRDTTVAEFWGGGPTWPNGEIYYAPAIADIDNDDTVEVLILEYWATAPPITITRCINGITYETEWRREVGGGYSPCLQLADVDDDSLLEIVALGIPDPAGWENSLIIVFNESVDIKEKYKLILLRKNEENKFIYNISGRKFLKENLKKLPSGIYFSPFEKKKYLKIFKGGIK